jgi:hypothetical protein
MDIKSIIANIVEKKLKKDSDDPCWDGYVQLGMKKKDGKEVPNCVPKESVELDEVLAKDYSGMLGSFKKAVERAEQAKKKGSTEKMEMQLDNARRYLFGMKSTDTAKLKNSDHYDRYKEMKGLKESVELDEAKFKLGDTVMDKKGNGEFIVTEVIPNITPNKPAAYRLARPTGSQSPNVWPESRLKLVKESVDLDEASMTFQDAEKLKSKHLVAADHHRKSGNSKGYAAHSSVVSKFEDSYDRHGTGVIPAGRILTASQKAFKDYPHSSMKESHDLSERVEVDHSRYMRSHSKKARGRGTWMFTTKDMGEPSEDEMVTVSGDLSTAAKEAAKKLGVKRVYVMESVELDENIKNVGDAMLKFLATTGTPHGTYSRQEVKDEHNRRMKWDSIYRKTKALHSKESVELDEVSMDKIRKVQDRAADRIAGAVGKTEKDPKTGLSRYVPPTDQEKELGQRGVKSFRAASRAITRKSKNEEVELDEAKTDVYHKHMLKALGKSKLPKNHSFTSAIADNGDFIVRDGGGRVVGRIPKGEHDLKESTELDEGVHNDLNDAIIDFQKKLMRMTRQLDPAIAKEVKKIDKDLDDLRSGPLFKIRPGR